MEKIRIILTRTVGTPAVTQGELQEEVTGFRCCTLERRDPRHWGGMKNLCAIPAGTYRLKIYTMKNLAHNFQLSMTGTYRNAVFSDCASPGETPAGCICVGTRCDLKKGVVEDGKRVVEKIGEWIMHLMRTGLISIKMKTGEVELVVRYAPNYYYDMDAQDESRTGGLEDDEQDWNLAE